MSSRIISAIFSFEMMPLIHYLSSGISMKCIQVLLNVLSMPLISSLVFLIFMSLCFILDNLL